MMSGVPLETCSAFNKLWNNKFYYKAASCWYFYLVCMYVQGGPEVSIQYIVHKFLYTYIWPTLYMLCYVMVRRLERCNYCDVEKSVGREIFV